MVPLPGEEQVSQPPSLTLSTPQGLCTDERQISTEARLDWGRTWLELSIYILGPIGDRPSIQDKSVWIRFGFLNFLWFWNVLQLWNFPWFRPCFSRQLQHRDIYSSKVLESAPWESWRGCTQSIYCHKIILSWGQNANASNRNFNFIRY